MENPLASAHRTIIPAASRYFARKIVRPAHRAAEEPDPDVAETYDQFGHTLYTLACVLTDDAKLAEQLVMQTIVAHQSGPSTLRELAAGVHVAWLAWGQPQSPAESSPPPVTAPEAQLMHQIHSMLADQRGALGLCEYGGHTYRQAAELLDLPPEQVARLLCDALRSLANPLASRFKPSPAA